MATRLASASPKHTSMRISMSDSLSAERQFVQQARGLPSASDENESSAEFRNGGWHPFPNAGRALLCARSQRGQADGATNIGPVDERHCAASRKASYKPEGLHAAATAIDRLDRLATISQRSGGSALRKISGGLGKDHHHDRLLQTGRRRTNGPPANCDPTTSRPTG